MEIYIIITAFIVCFLLIFLINKIKQNRKLSENFQNASAALNQKEQELTALKIENASLQTKLNAQNDAQQQLYKEFAQLQDNTRKEFEIIANKILDDKSKTFVQTNKENIDMILKPLKENIDKLERNTADRQIEQTKQNATLMQTVRNLAEQTNITAKTAESLANALRGDKKMTGNWGETVLAQLLENSGFKEHIHYQTQDSTINDENKTLFTDVIIKLPNERKVIIDSKVSLINYTNYYNSNDKIIQQTELDLHIKCVRSHIDELSKKEYWKQYKESLDFVIMFIPIEPAYLLAINGDVNLFEYAFRKQIILSSTTNLLAILKIFNQLWTNDKLERNYEKIIDEAGKMYDKFVGFLTNFETLGKQIETSSNTYNYVKQQLSDGKGNLISKAENLKLLGVKATKEIPQSFV